MVDNNSQKEWTEDQRVKKSRTVILWGQEDPLGSGVELFLAARKEWEVIRISNMQSANDLFEEVEKVEPDVVIIHQGNYAEDTHLPVQLFQNHPNLKVIVVSLEDNSMEIYSKQQVWVKEVSDLLTVVES